MTAGCWFGGLSAMGPIGPKGARRLTYGRAATGPMANRRPSRRFPFRPDPTHGCHPSRYTPPPSFQHNLKNKPLFCPRGTQTARWVPNEEIMILRGATDGGGSTGGFIKFTVPYTGRVIQVVIWAGSIYCIFRLECRATIKCVNFTKGCRWTAFLSRRPPSGLHCR